MSRKRGIQHRRRPRRPSPHQGVAIVAAWCQGDDDLPEARQQTHDKLCALMGDTRTSGVQWLWYRDEHATEALDRLQLEDDPPELSDYYRRIRAHLREYGGYLVVAMAEGIEPR